MTTTYDMPMPNDTYDGGTVVASCFVTDDSLGSSWLVLTLRSSPAFYRVGEYSAKGMAAHHGDFENVVHAVNAYVENGGDT